MKNLFLATFSILLFFSCSKKAADKITQTSSQPTPQPQMPQPKPVEVVTKGDDKLNIPEGISPDLLVSLLRTPCFGSCPSYKLEIFKDGTVKYKGTGYVKRLGFFTAKADSDFIAQIQKKAESINYMKLNSKYPIGDIEIADIPQTISYIRFGNDGKMINNNFDAPKELVAFERWLEKHIESLKWQEEKN